MWGLIPGLICSIFIIFCTKVSVAPPKLLIIFAILGFIISLFWVKFAADIVVDLLKIFGNFANLPSSILALTVLSWGNIVGDLSANLAMTKKGFGEMAITGSMAGCIFNINMGLGASFLI